MQEKQNNTGPTSGFNMLTLIARSLITGAILAAVLFISSGKTNWIGGWMYITVVVAGQIVAVMVAMPKSPETIAARSVISSEAPAWDRAIAPIITLAPQIIAVTAGLFVRFRGVPHTPIWIVAAGMILAVLGFTLGLQAALSNKFFTPVYCIQKDRGHTVIEDGPYRIIRHPGYAGTILFLIAIPMILGAAWAYLPAVLTVLLLVLRTHLEDRALRSDLHGYSDYAVKVSSHLLPGVW
ncbi:MAG TPA: isoprenylcysteine carboxylmethyltransferase family protein [Armatimonadota bacterium]